MGELGRNLDRLGMEVHDMATELRKLADLPRRMESVEDTIRSGQERKSGATWSVAQHIVGTIVAAVILALIINGGIKG